MLPISRPICAFVCPFVTPVETIDVKKNVFYVFYSCHVFTFFNVFYFPYVFIIKTLKICFLCKLIVRFNFSYATFLNSKLVRLWEFNQ